MIETSPLIWQPILRGIILNTRPRKSARAYVKIWNQETNESPLRYFTRLQAEKLNDRLGDTLEVEWAMRYGAPSIADKLAELIDLSGAIALSESLRGLRRINKVDAETSDDAQTLFMARRAEMIEAIGNHHRVGFVGSEEEGGGLVEHRRGDRYRENGLRSFKKGRVERVPAGEPALVFAEQDQQPRCRISIRIQCSTSLRGDGGCDPHAKSVAGFRCGRRCYLPRGCGLGVWDRG